MKLAKICDHLGGRLIGDGEIEIRGLARIEDATRGELTFLANPKYAKYLETTAASAILVAGSIDYGTINIAYIQVEDAYLSFQKCLKLFYQEEAPPFRGVHKNATVAESAKIGKNVHIGPHVYIGDKVSVGDNTVIYPGCVLETGVTIGSDCKLYSNVNIRYNCHIHDRAIIHCGVVIGSDGFGFAPDGESYEKIPQVGNVVVEDDVEIGSNCTIDRATIGETRIKRGCKLDNLVQIAHNVVLGEDTVIAAQTGISGSTRVGNHVTLAGQVGIVGHIEIGDNAIIAAQSGVSKSVPAKEVWFGYPAGPLVRQKKTEAVLRHLPELNKRVHQLEKTIIELEERLKKTGG